MIVKERRIAGSCRGVILTPPATARPRGRAMHRGEQKRERRDLLHGHKADHIAAIVELHVILAADLDTVNGVVERVKRKRLRCQTFHVAGLAQIVNLIEVVGIAGFLGNTFQTGLSVDFDTHFAIPHLVKFRAEQQRYTFALRV